MENGFDLSWAWGIGLIGFSFGLVCGMAGLYLASGNKQRQRVRQLETELEGVQKEFNGYREQVGQHFQKTSDLVQKMTASYRDVYEHLASGSQALCHDPVATPQLDIPHQPMLDKAEEQATSAAESEEKPAEEATNGFSDAETDTGEARDSEVYLGDAPNIPDLGNETRH